MPIFKSKFFLLTVLSLFWGSQFLLLKQGIDQFPIFVLATIRAILAGITLFIVCLLLKLKNNHNHWFLYLFLAFFEGTLPFILLTYGSSLINSSLASILMGCIPLMTVLWSLVFIKNYQLTGYTIGSICLGFIGLLIVFYPSLRENNNNEMIGALMIIIGAACFGFGMIMIKKYAKETPILISRNILIMSAIELSIIFILLFILNKNNIIHINVHMIPVDFQFLNSINTNAWVSISVLSIFSTGLAYILFMTLIQSAGPQFASLTNYLVPVIGLLLGFFILHEEINLHEIVGLIIICIAIVINK